MPAVDKLDLRSVGLVCVETHYPELARFAIERCLAGADFKECLLLTSRLHALRHDRARRLSAVSL